jgi:hypothetical protein
MAGRSNFRRVLLGLHQHPAQHGLRLAIDVAVLLRLDLCGFFVKEESLGRLAALPFTREFRPLGGGWRPIDLDSLSQEMELAANTAQHLFDQAVKGLGLTSRFEVVSGTLPENLALLSRQGDIVIVCEPTGAARLSMPPSSSLVEAAFRSTAAVMLAPQGARWRPGPVVAIATAPDDPSVEVAAGIAAAAKEELVVIESCGPAAESQTGRMAAEGRPDVRRLRVANISSLDNPEIIGVLAALRARLVVINRRALGETVAATLASRLGVPILMVSDGELANDSLRRE